MTRKLTGVARKALRLALIELLIPGGTLVVLVLLLTGGRWRIGSRHETRLQLFPRA